MKDEDLLELLSQAAQLDQPPLDERWQKMCTGDLLPAELDDLLTADDADSLVAIFEPLGSDFDEAIVDEIMGGVAVEVPDVEPSSSVPRPANTSMRWLLPLMAVAVALVVAIFVPWSTEPGYQELPSYAIEVVGGDKTARGVTGPDQAVLSLAAGSRAELRLRPAEAVGVPIDASAFVVRGGEVEPWPGAPIEVSEDGAARLVIRPSHDGLSDDATSVILVVHPVGAGDAQASAVASVEQASSQRWPVARVELRVVGAP